MSKNLVITLVLALCLAVPAFAEIDLSGIVIAEFYDQEIDGQNYVSQTTRGKNPATFDISVVELDIDADLTEKISTRVDLEFESRYSDNNVNGTGRSVDVEQAYIKIAEIFDWPVDIVVGKFNAPWGQQPEEEYDLKLITHSLVWEWTDIGNLTGIAISGGVSFVDYVLWAANGVHPALNSVTAGADRTSANPATTAIAGGPYNAAAAANRKKFDVDFNNDDQGMALGFRIGIAPEIIEGFEAGLSFVVDTVDPRHKYIKNDYVSMPSSSGKMANNEERLQMYDVDAVYQTGPFEIRFEYVDGRVRVADNPSANPAGAGYVLDQEMNFRGYTFQGSYDVSDRLTLVARYGYYDQDRNRTPKEDREEMSVGVNYKVADGVVSKLEYRLNDEALGLGMMDAATLLMSRRQNLTATANPVETDNNQISAQLGVSF
jgi:hypothetical protein